MGPRLHPADLHGARRDGLTPDRKVAPVSDGGLYQSVAQVWPDRDPPRCRAATPACHARGMGRTPGWPDEPDGVYQEGEPGNEVNCCLASCCLFFIGAWILLLWTVAHARHMFV
ncbi:hypothetical protein GCM10022284_67170 [Streptomyces hundungensis]